MNSGGQQARAREFLERVRSEVLVADGATGTALYSRGFSYQSCFEELNESRPAIVEELHREYVHAGAQIIETNTFGANYFRLAEHGFEKRVREINRAGAQIAQRVAGRSAFVAGSVGPLNRILEPIGTLTIADARRAFDEQVAGLLEGGVDLFIVETMSSVAEIREALLSIKAHCDLPVIASMTFTEDGKTLVGEKPGDIRRVLSELGADVIGANCSVGPQAMLDVVERLSSGATVPISAQPNAGMPRVVGGRYIYLASPQYFADYARRFVEAGATIVGGCCGTTVEHIRGISAAVKGLKPGRVTSVSARDVDDDEVVTVTGGHKVHNDFRTNLGKKFLISVEIDPPRSINPSPFVRHAQLLKQQGADLINVADSPLARSRLSALAMSHVLRRDAGVDVLMHVSCRDRNAIALQSELLGAHVLGVQNILAVTGDPTSVGDYPFAKAVFELDSIHLTKLVSQMNAGKDLTGRNMEEATDFLVGVGVNPTATDLPLELDRFRQKIDGGAQFAFTQPLFDPGTLEDFLSAVAAFCRIPILVGILPLRSAKHSEFIHNEIPDMFVPEDVRDRMRNSGTEGAKIGVEIAQKFLLDTKPMVQGAYLMPPFNKFEMATEVMSVLTSREL